MSDLFWVLFVTVALAVPLYLFEKMSGLVETFLASRKRSKQLKWELQQTEDIIGLMYDEGTVDKMTKVEREELIKLLAKEYPLWYEVYGKHYNV